MVPKKFIGGIRGNQTIHNCGKFEFDGKRKQSSNIL